jgi:hypothetical protein
MESAIPGWWYFSFRARREAPRDLHAIHLWYLETLVVRNLQSINVVPSSSGSYTFLETAVLTTN